MKCKASFVRSIVIALAVVFTTPAFAKDVCVEDGSLKFVFKKVKALKAGRAIALQGVAVLDTDLAAPFDGSAIMLSDGTTVQVGIFVHGIAASANDFTVAWTTTTAFSGTASVDDDGDFEANTTLTLSTVDCATVTIP